MCPCVAGAYGNNPGTGESAGSAYVIEGDDDNNWVVVQKLVASDSAQSSFFGRSVDVKNSIIVVGADGESSEGLLFSLSTSLSCE